MNKELQAFKDLLKQLFPNYDVDVSFDDICNLNGNLNIIRNALKRLEEHDKIFKKYNMDDNWLEPALYVIKNHFPMDTEAKLKKLEALEIISNILKHTSHIRLGERRNFGEGKTSYYLIVSCGAGECEYKLKNKEEYDTLKEIL